MYGNYLVAGHSWMAKANNAHTGKYLGTYMHGHQQGKQNKANGLRVELGKLTMTPDLRMNPECHRCNY